MDTNDCDKQRDLLQTAQEGKEELERMFQNLQRAANTRAGRRNEADIAPQRGTQAIALEAILSHCAALEREFQPDTMYTMYPVTMRRRVAEIRALASDALKATGNVISTR